MGARMIGILVAENKPPFQEKKFYARLGRCAASQNLALIVFSASAVDWENNQVVGYRYETEDGAWKKGKYALPDIIYDRFFCHLATSDVRCWISNVKKIRAMKPSRLLGNPIAGKWRMHRILSRHHEIKPYLPASVPYRGFETFIHWLQHRRHAVLKPVSGSCGRGILLVQAMGSGRFFVQGRDANNQVIQRYFSRASQLHDWIKHFMHGRPYIVQQYLTLTNHDQRTYDIRALVQKNEKGCWQLTGTAVRVGALGGLTSNLSGGGTAVRTVPFLQTLFPKSKAEQIYADICRLSAVIPPFLEQYFGRLAELGIDYGIDRDGRIWVLEVNSKPGRSVFEYIGDRAACHAAIIRPLSYARYLVDRQLGG